MGMQRETCRSSPLYHLHISGAYCQAGLITLIDLVKLYLYFINTSTKGEEILLY